MSTVQSLRCDNLISTKPTPASPYTVGITDRIECAAVSRAARTPGVLTAVTERDGWITRPDGTHLCPSCATAAKETAA
jgi:hypothetical protein